MGMNPMLSIELLRMNLFYVKQAHAIRREINPIAFNCRIVNMDIFVV